MFNIIRADFYRILHSKIFYLTQIALFVMVLVNVSSHTTFLAGIQSDDFMNVVHNIERSSWTGATALVGTSLMAGALIYFYLPLFILSIGYDLTHGTIKNLISSGFSRQIIFVSKYITFLILSAAEYLFYFVLAFSIASISSGIGVFKENFLYSFLQSMGIQFLSLQAIFAVTILILYVSRSNVAAVIATVSFPVLLSTVSVLLFPKSKIIQYFDFQGNINNTFLSMPKDYWLNVSLFSIVFIIIWSSISYIWFKRQEL